MDNSAAEIGQPMRSRSSGKAGQIVRRTARVDGRSKAALAVKAKLAAYASRLGPAVDAVEQAARLRAAELGAVADQLRAARLRGEPIDVVELTKAQGYADRAERALSVDRKPSQPAPAPNTIAGKRLADLIRERERARMRE
jgi:hypothetical protein